MAAEEEECKCEAGAPAWMVTFSDLMTLLLTFFVLLLSNAELDAKKYQEMVQSLHDAFHGQKIIGKPLAAVLIRTESMEIGSERENNEETSDSDGTGGMQGQDGLQTAQEVARNMYKILEEDLAEEMMDDKVTSMELSNDQILVRFPASVTFSAGSDVLSPEIRQVIKKIGTVMTRYPVNVSITGHTDSIPINTSRFRSNWDLSAARAASFAHELIDIANLESNRVTVIGKADAAPLSDNATAENRATNRRIELLIQVPPGLSPEAILGTQEEMPDGVNINTNPEPDPLTLPTESEESPE